MNRSPLNKSPPPPPPIIPRRRKSEILSHKQPISSDKTHMMHLDKLIQMGFSERKAFKALAATGFRDTNVAVHWLIQHTDADLGSEEGREYILYLIPHNGPLSDDIDTYFKKSESLEWNGAHDWFPHLSLTGFFTVPDKEAYILSDIVHEAIRSVGGSASNNEVNMFTEPLRFRKETTSNQFIGLFPPGEKLERLARSFSNICKAKLGVTPPVKSNMHLSLAYNFDPAFFSKFDALANQINLSRTCDFDVRLFSRDSEFKDCHVFQVIHKFRRSQVDELELIPQDFLYVLPSEIKDSTDGWYKGTSWRNGDKGLFPGVFTKQVAAMNTWVLQKWVKVYSPAASSAARSCGVGVDTPEPIYGKLWADAHNVSANASSGSPYRQSTSDLFDELQEQNTSSNVSISSSTSSSPQQQATASVQGGGGTSEASSSSAAASGLQLLNTNQSMNGSDCFNMRPLSDLIDFSEPHAAGGPTGRSGPRMEVTASSSSCSSTALQPAPQVSNKKVVVIRHGERVDMVFGVHWYGRAFTEDGDYIRFDCNMPNTLPIRPDSVQWAYESPLTRIGQFQAQLVGESFLDNGVSFGHVYCSPAYRCVQTATHLLKGMNKDSLSLKIEPGLFEWLAWYRVSLPSFFTPQELSLMGFNVDKTYTPIISACKLEDHKNEALNDLYYRHDYVTTKCLENHEHDGQNILIVAHAGSLDTCTRLLTNGELRDNKTFNTLNRQVSYCSSVVLQKIGGSPTWSLVAPLSLPLVHNPNKAHDWQLHL